MYLLLAGNGNVPIYVWFGGGRLKPRPHQQQCRTNFLQNFVILMHSTSDLHHADEVITAKRVETTTSS